SLHSLDPRIRLALANSLWAAQRAPLKPGFSSRNRLHYQAEIANVDFGDSATCGRINSWVKEQTQNKIDNLVKPEDCTPDTLLMLLDAIYFKGAWSDPFDPGATRPGPFTLANGKRKQVSMMRRSGRQTYFEDRSLQAVSIPYGQGDITFDILLPKEGGRLVKMLEEIDVKSWDKTISRLTETNIDLGLPRWKLEEEAELNRPLPDLGMKLAFTGKADFSDMTDEQAMISVVRHKSYLEVNEEGTEATAATAVTMVRMAAFYARPVINVDHPFLCAIRHKPTGLLLFLGLVNDPG
ncbi:MAG: serpin family protein, partial [Rudaea sp.]